MKVAFLETTSQAPRLLTFLSCSTQLSMKFVMLINLKELTIANSFLLNIAEHEIFSANKYLSAEKKYAQLSCA